ncbi:MAG: ABC transporter ATP-binding protein [Rhodocyclaceae bacterium]
MLELRDLAHRYAGSPRPALDGVSLTARRGEVLGLLGPNGAGKTTLISHLAGLLPIQQGQILVDGTTLDAARHQRPTRIAIAPQEYAFYPSLSVRENLECFAGVCGLRGSQRDARIASCLSFAQLERFSDKRASQLSGGLKRRLNLAIALLPEPELVLFDEPTVGVDPQSRAFIIDAVKSLARSGTAVIYTTHYMEEIEAIADQVVIMDHGKVLRAGTLAELLSQGAPRLRLLLGKDVATTLASQLNELGECHAEGEYLVISLAADTTPEFAISKVAASGATIREIDYGRYNLEHLFMALTQRSLRDD